MSSAQSVIATFNATANVFASRTGISTGSCGSSAPCDVFRALQVVTCGQTLQLNDDGGLGYTGARYMLNFTAAGVTTSCTSGNEITVQAQTDGGVFINGQSVRAPFAMEGISYWIFRGFDVGNSGAGGVMEINDSTPSTGLQFKRIVAYNASPGNNHVWTCFAGCLSAVFEDIAGFGTGRNIFIEGSGENGTVIRRGWFRWEGGPTAAAPSGPVQSSYNGLGGFLYEDIITVYAPFDDTSDGSGILGANVSMTQRDAPATFSDRYRGWIGYALGSRTGTWALLNGAQWNNPGGAGISWVDVFLDIRSETTTPKPIGIAGSAFNTLDRVTSIKLATQGASDSGAGWTVTNFNECDAAVGVTGSTIGGCPNFYTGVTNGARNCFEYSNGTLTSTKKWPWRMDDRIKAAIARAGDLALTGVAGSGGTSTWAAGTVTSEIVARYGAMNSGCVR